MRKFLFTLILSSLTGLGFADSQLTDHLHEIDYSDPINMISSSEFEINSPAPHGLAINSNGSEIYVASNSADWIYKIVLETNEIIGSVMDVGVNNTPDQITQRLKPIQCLSVGNKLFVSCSAGPWMDPWTGVTSVIQGQLQMWNSDTMTLIDSIEF